MINDWFQGFVLSGLNFQQVPRICVTSEMLVNNLKTKEEKEMVTEYGIVLDGVKYVREDSINNVKEDGLDVVLVRAFGSSQYVGLLEKIDGDTVYLKDAFATDYGCVDEAMALTRGILANNTNNCRTVINSKLIVRGFATIHYMNKLGYEMAKSFHIIDNK